MTFGFLLVLILAVLGIWYLLDRREKARLANGLSRHSGMRLIFASFAILTVLFSGGCGGLFLFSWIADGMSRNERFNCNEPLEQANLGGELAGGEWGLRGDVFNHF